MRGKLFNEDEVTLCTYAARFDKRDIGGLAAIQNVAGRGRGSIVMKIRNIASMLDEHGISRESDVSPLTGKPPGEDGRLTNWGLVERLARLSKSDLLKKCKEICG